MTVTAIIHDPHRVRNVVFVIGLCVCTGGDGNDLKTQLCVADGVDTTVHTAVAAATAAVR